MIKDVLKVKNAYDNFQERVSFEIMVSKCTDLSKGCALAAHAEKVLKTIYFTNYFIEDTISYSTKLATPIITQDAFHS